MTSSPSPIPNASKARYTASNPFATPMQYRVPVKRAYASSKSMTPFPKMKLPES